MVFIFQLRTSLFLFNTDFLLIESIYVQRKKYKLMFKDNKQVVFFTLKQKILKIL